MSLQWNFYAHISGNIGRVVANVYKILQSLEYSNISVAQCIEFNRF